MKSSLDHLPLHKQEEIRLATAIIRDMVKIDMIILFGSYARGDWVEDRQPDGMNMHEYKSDLDLLIVVKHETLVTKIERMQSLEDRLDREIKTPVSLLPEDIHFFNKRVGEGQYFYKDILEEGILLYDSKKLKLESPRALHPNERRQLAVDDFEYWFSSAIEHFSTYNLILSDDKKSNIAAFMLHQVTERFYSALLLVFIYYKPNTHDLEKLHKRASTLDPAILEIFPRDTPEEKRLFELLRKAYVDARYKKSYRITKDELQELGHRVKRLEILTESLCKQKIESF